MVDSDELVVTVEVVKVLLWGITCVIEDGVDVGGVDVGGVDDDVVVVEVEEEEVEPRNDQPIIQIG